MVNEEIKGPKVRLVDDNGATEMNKDDALKLAQEHELDLYVVGFDKNIPIVKIGDYNKFMYNKNKKQKENEKKARLGTLDFKEIQISDSIMDHDLEIKANKIDKLLLKGAKIKLSIRYKGRARAFINEGPEKIQKLIDKITSKFKVETEATIQGNTVFAVISSVK